MSVIKKILILNTILILSIASLSQITIATEREDVASHNLNYDLLMITSKEFLSALQPLKIHKDQMGIETIIVTVEEVYKQTFWQGRDNSEKIKYFIKNAVENLDIKYVFLVGGMKNQGPAWYIPVRYVYTNDGYDDIKFISELYYADIYDDEGNFSNWDSDNDGIFGEWFGPEADDKNIDLKPDIFFGRIPCRNEKEVKIMVDKIIKYETQMYQQAEKNKITVVSGDIYPHTMPWCDPTWTDYEGEILTQHVLDNMTDYEHEKLWMSEETLNGPNDVIKAFNNGCGFIFFGAHGTPLRLQLFDTENSKWVKILTQSSLKKLKNEDIQPICVVSSCHVFKFDVNIHNLIRELKEYKLNFLMENINGSIVGGQLFKFRWVPECIGWKITCLENGGAVSSVGCTSYGLSKEDKKINLEGGLDYLMPNFFRQIGVNKVEHLGEAWANSINDYLIKYPIDWGTPSSYDSSIDAKTVEQWIVCGDPSLKIGGYNVS